MEANRQKHRLKSIATQILQREIAQTGIQPKLRTEIENFPYLRLNGVPREAILWDAEAEHAPKCWRSFEEGHGITKQSQIVYSGETGGAGTNHGHAFGMSDFRLLWMNVNGIA
jgi:hypothetical protein